MNGPDRPDETAPHGGREPLSWSLRELVSRIDASTRLSHVAERNDLFATTTVGDFLAARAAVAGRLRSLPNFGRRCLAELDLAVSRFEGQSQDAQVVGPNIPADIAVGIADTSAGSDEFAAGSLPIEIRDLTLREVVTRVGASVRLSRASSDSKWFVDTTLGSFLDGSAARLPFVKNLGRTSRAELDELIKDFVQVAAEMVDAATSAGSGLAPRDSRELGDLSAVIETACKATAVRRFASADVDSAGTAQDGVWAAVRALEQNQQFVIERRYGLSGHEPQTLEEVGEQARVTRERVRQVERKALSRLRSAAALLFQRFLQSEEARIIELLTKGLAVLPLYRVIANSKELDALHTLAIDVAHFDLDSYLQTIGTLVDGQWRRNETYETQDGQRDQVASAIGLLALPRPVVDVAARVGLAAPALKELVATQRGVSCHNEFVFSGFTGAKAKRVAAIYETARTLPGLFDVQTLVGAYRQARPTDAVGSRLILTALEANRHLFAHMFDSLWLTLPLAPDWASGVSTLPFERRPMADDGGFESGTIGRLLVDTLRSQGPGRINDLAEAVERLKASRVSTSPILLANPCFQRIAPGVFDLYTGDPFRDAALLTSQQCRNYAFARFGAAPVEYFPAWDTGFEQRLLAWAQSNAPTDVFRSLLSVAQPDNWDEPTERERWRALASTHGDWALRTTRQARLTGPLPKPESLFAGLVHLRLFGNISWCGANRVSQQRFDSESGAELVALLVAIGAAAPATEWQEAHFATPQAAAMLDLLAEERWREGRLSWERCALSEWLDRARADGRTIPGWLGQEEMSNYLDEAFLAKPPEVPDVSPEKPAVGIEDLLESDEFSRLFES